jgi:hypothetical protein
MGMDKVSEERETAGGELVASPFVIWITGPSSQVRGWAGG